jgi:hypothetical protein
MSLILPKGGIINRTPPPFSVARIFSLIGVRCVTVVFSPVTWGFHSIINPGEGMPKRLPSGTQKKKPGKIAFPPASHLHSSRITSHEGVNCTGRTLTHHRHNSNHLPMGSLRIATTPDSGGLLFLRATLPRCSSATSFTRESPSPELFFPVSGLGKE